jgi:hypothetical protein
VRIANVIAGGEFDGMDVEACESFENLFKRELR